jgi:hypothetical protein
MDVTISPLSFERWPPLENLFGRAGGLERVLVHVLAYRPATVTGPERTTSATCGSSPRLGSCRACLSSALTWRSAGASWRREPNWGGWRVPGTWSPADDLCGRSRAFLVQRPHRHRGVMGALIEASAGVAAA